MSNNQLNAAAYTAHYSLYNLVLCLVDHTAHLSTNAPRQSALD